MPNYTADLRHVLALAGQIGFKQLVLHADELHQIGHPVLGSVTDAHFGHFHTVFEQHRLIFQKPEREGSTLRSVGDLARLDSLAALNASLIAGTLVAQRDSLGRSIA